MTYSEDVNRVKGYEEARIEALEKEVKRLNEVLSISYKEIEGLNEVLDKKEAEIIQLVLRLNYYKNADNG